MAPRDVPPSKRQGLKSSATVVVLLGILCTQVPGALAFIDWQGDWGYGCDFPGNDLSSLTNFPPERCGPQCQSTPGCTHYVFKPNFVQGGTCTLKTGRVSKSSAVVTDRTTICGLMPSASLGSPGASPPPGATPPPPIPVSCPQLGGVTGFDAALKDMDHNGNDITCIRGTDAAAAGARCRDDPTCLAFNVDYNNGHSCLKHKADPVSRESGNPSGAPQICFWRKSCPAVGVFRAGTRDVDRPGDDITCMQSTDPTLLAQRCQEDDSCRSFLINYSTGRACLKRRADPLTPISGSTPGRTSTCAYVKPASELPPRPAVETSSRVWLPRLSDGTPPALCVGGFMTGLRCAGRYCDDLFLQCATAPRSGQGSWTRWFSEEGANSESCPAGSFVAGIRCRESFCDEVSLFCQAGQGVREQGCRWTPQITDGWSGVGFEAPEGFLVRGVRCSGRYCDDMRLEICNTAPEDNSAIQKMAQKYAPVLRFDQAATGLCLPSSGEDYWVARKGGSGSRMCNQDEASVRRGEVPIYYWTKTCGDAIYIMYWFFYGYQAPCAARGLDRFLDAFNLGFGSKLGEHDSDWEGVTVRVSAKDSSLQKVMYFQHSARYTRTPGGFEVVDGTHPVVYVGKVAHGSYHNFWNGMEANIPFVECAYWADFRNPGSKDLRLETWKYLQRLRGDSEAPEWMKQMSRFIAVGSVLEKDTLVSLRDTCKVAACVKASKKAAGEREPCEISQGGDEL